MSSKETFTIPAGPYTCPFCKQYASDSVDSVSRHVGRLHKDQYTKQQLYQDLFLEGKTPTCACGCGEPTKFLSVCVGFRRYRVGHDSRVHNNYQIEKAITNSRNTMRKKIEAGEWTHLRGGGWSKGLTKETDPRVRKMSESILSNEEEITNRSERFKRLRADGTVRTLYGPEHSQWKGGISSLNNLCRSYPRLYKEWKYPKLVEAGFKCAQCGNTKQLEVHHDGETFSSVLRKVAREHGWELSITTKTETSERIEELKQRIKDGIVDYHVRENVSGRVLCVDCHTDLHDSYHFPKDNQLEG